jgi:hypothetical protein
LIFSKNSEKDGIEVLVVFEIFSSQSIINYLMTDLIMIMLRKQKKWMVYFFSYLCPCEQFSCNNFLRGFVGETIIRKYAQSRWGLATRERHTNEPVKRRGSCSQLRIFFILCEQLLWSVLRYGQAERLAAGGFRRAIS